MTFFLEDFYPLYTDSGNLYLAVSTPFCTVIKYFQAVTKPLRAVIISILKLVHNTFKADIKPFYAAIEPF